MLGISVSVSRCRRASFSVQISIKLLCSNPPRSCPRLSTSGTWYISHVPQAITVGSTLSSDMKATIVGFV